MHYYIDVIKKYAVFDGRARRKEYWMFYLINFLIELVLGIGMFFIIFGGRYESVMILNLLNYAYSLFIFLPTLALTVRRLHDTGHSGWWMFISLVPLFGGIIFLIFMLIDSDMGTNRYGPSPKYSRIEEPASR